MLHSSLLTKTFFPPQTVIFGLGILPGPEILIHWGQPTTNIKGSKEEAVVRFDLELGGEGAVILGKGPAEIEI